MDYALIFFIDFFHKLFEVFFSVGARNLFEAHDMLGDVEACYVELI
jgi:hypothetical protein